MSYFEAVYAALMATEPLVKRALIDQLYQSAAVPDFSQPHLPVVPFAAPGRPIKPELIDPRDVPHRGLGTQAGRAAMCHAVAHIEFNAINLALDACYRFRDMPTQYYVDWLSVAWDEARHFSLLVDRMALMGCSYGDYRAHNGLWDMAVRSDHDVLVRMALVPRVLEARGLDVTPGMIRRLTGANDPETVAVLKVILAEEVRHVEIGSHWYQFLCQQRGLDHESYFLELLAEYDTQVKLPMNEKARAEAGFSAEELRKLNATFS
ncbi:MAG: uncharacterized ferritin-like protein (DUF455 family) [Gammaproteobacteria bacterium]|jgi:uncharacterized ferritin-like protein (DUF455 family)